MSDNEKAPWYHGVKLVADFHNERQSGGRFVTSILQPGNIVPVAAVPTGVEGYGREEGRRFAELFASAPQTAMEWDALQAQFAKLTEEKYEQGRQLATVKADNARLREALADLIDKGADFVHLVRGSGPRPPRICDALDSARAALSPVTGGVEKAPVWSDWIKWEGGECPIPWAKALEYELRLGEVPVRGDLDAVDDRLAGSWRHDLLIDHLIDGSAIYYTRYTAYRYRLDRAPQGFTPPTSTGDNND